MYIDVYYIENEVTVVRIITRQNIIGRLRLSIRHVRTNEPP